MSYVRTLKPGFFRSESIARLSYRARLTFAGLWTESDARGRAIANARVLAGAIWSLDDAVTSREVEEDLQALHETGHIVLYEVAGKRYCQVLQWDEHQAAQYRRHESRLPDPPESHSGTFESAEKCPEMQKMVGSRNRNRNSNTRDDEWESDFNECWEIYPKKLDRKAALKSYNTKRRNGAKPDVLLTATQNFATAMRNEDRDQKYIMGGSRFFGPTDPWEEYINPIATEKPKSFGPVVRSRKDTALGDVAAYRDIGEDELANELQSKIDNGDFN